MKNILVAVDMETGDQLLLDQASALASKFDSKVWIIHIAAPEPDFVGYDPGPVYIRKTLADELRSEHKTLHKYSESLLAQNINAESLLVQGPTVQTIFDEAQKLESDLLILGSHKHNFLKRVFGQEVTREIFQQSKTPMLIIPLGE
jgi:nucleotide-binding universal stress UspA family protein